MGNKLFYVTSKGIEQIIAVFDSVAIAMTSQIKAYSVIPALRYPLRRTQPSISALSASVKKEDGWTRRISIGSSGEFQPVTC